MAALALIFLGGREEIFMGGVWKMCMKCISFFLSFFFFFFCPEKFVKFGLTLWNHFGGQENIFGVDAPLPLATPLDPNLNLVLPYTKDKPWVTNRSREIWVRKWVLHWNNNLVEVVVLQDCKDKMMKGVQVVSKWLVLGYVWFSKKYSEYNMANNYDNVFAMNG